MTKKPKHMIAYTVDPEDGYVQAKCLCGYRVAAPKDKSGWVKERAADHLDEVSRREK